jgi:hypothetical protein
MARGARRADDGDVTDNSGGRGRRLLGATPQPWQLVLAAGLAVLTTATVVVVTHTSDPASASTYVSSVRNAVVRLADGHERTAQVGDRLPPGAQLRTGTDGGAELSTAGRDVYLGALSTVDVVDGVRQSLQRGQVMVDTRKGPRLELGTSAGEVTARTGSLVRVEALAVFLRTGVFDGAAAVTPTGRRLTTSVRALHQVQVPYASTPGPVTALTLRDDRWEARLAADLVNADQDLAHLADNLGGVSGAALLTAAPVSLRAPVPASGAARGEQALAVALAQAATVGTDLAGKLDAVSSARSEGGSWGVIAALVGARVTTVSALLDAALLPATSGPAPGSTVSAGQVPSLTDLLGQLTPTAAPRPVSTPAPVTKPPTKAPPRPGGGGGTPPPPPPTSDPLLVTLLNTVVGLLPLPSPTPTSGTGSTSPVLPTPTPTPLLGVDLNLGGLLK